MYIGSAVLHFVSKSVKTCRFIYHFYFFGNSEGQNKLETKEQKCQNKPGSKRSKVPLRAKKFLRCTLCTVYIHMNEAVRISQIIEVPCRTFFNNYEKQEAEKQSAVIMSFGGRWENCDISENRVYLARARRALFVHRYLRPPTTIDLQMTNDTGGRPIILIATFIILCVDLATHDTVASAIITWTIFTLLRFLTSKGTCFSTS
jgi:hypothetical protein